MNILVFSTVFYPSIGGIENQTLLLVKEFVHKGHTVKVITSQIQGLPLKGVTVYYRPGFLTCIKLFLWCSTYYMPNISLKGVWVLIFGPKKAWVVSHNDFSSCNKKGLLPYLKNFTIKFASQNIAVSKSVADCVGPGTVVVHNCYDDSTFKIYEDEKRTVDFVFLGRLVTQKGCDLLIKACAELKEPFHLNIIGDGPEKKRLVELADNLRIADKITFSGMLRGEELARTLNRCRVMIIPSLQGEGFGMVALEGLACGCRLIAANAAGLVEAVGDYGKKFIMGNQNELTKLLEHEIENREIIPSQDDRVIEYLRKHSTSVVSDRYLEYFT